ncbi:hypothetical protein AB3M83_05550 [Microbacterium sp. 179-B 1A2 NHS]|uniref:hypothetical protein n=1 Tax=Microbacterium sp. 179-B 1A2 NHS TaxID=3142383 RepID=UPI0039A3D8F3
MSVPDTLPRDRTGGVVAVWVAALVVALSIGIFVEPDWRGAWLSVGLGVCVILSFAVQLVHGRSQGFIVRVAASVLGAMVVMGLIGAGFALAELFAA